VAAINLRLKQGESASSLQEAFGQSLSGASPALATFIKAYLVTRSLPRLTGDELDRTAASAAALLASAWPELRGKRAAQALYGAILHEQLLRTRDLAAAERANLHYLIALELSEQSPRYRAMLLGQLGLLHTQVGNYRVALSYLEDREQLPFTQDAEGLAVKLARARALFHTERETEAAKVAEDALRTVEGTSALARYQVLALDRAALYHLSAGEYPRALALYDRALPLLGKERALGTAENEFLMRLAHAAAALGAGAAPTALADLEAVDRALTDEALMSRLNWAHLPHERVLRTYRLIAAGLRANAQKQLGDKKAAGQALEARRGLILESLKASDRDEDYRAATLVEARLGQLAADAQDWTSAAKWVGLALGHADAFVERTHAPVHPDQLNVLLMGAELGILRQANLPFPLLKELRKEDDQVLAFHDPAFRAYERWLEIYLSLANTP
jgi:hypothetical protein